jgi:hypothetical protein
VRHCDVTLEHRDSQVADYSVVLSGPPVEAALEDWPFDSHVLKLNKRFSRAGGFKELLDAVITTPNDQSLVSTPLWQGRACVRHFVSRPLVVDMRGRSCAT